MTSDAGFCDQAQCSLTTYCISGSLRLGAPSCFICSTFILPSCLIEPPTSWEFIRQC